MKGIAIAVIGAGWWATYNHLPSLEDYKSIKRIIVVDKKQDRLKVIDKKFKVDAVYTSIKDLMENENINGAIIATPHKLHFKHAVNFVTKGIPVLVEKPMTTSAEDAKMLVELAGKHSTDILIANGWNFTPYMQKARDKIRDGVIGNIQHVVAQMASPLADLFNGEPMQGTETHIFRPKKSTWADPKNAGGYGWGQLSHLLAALYYLIDEDPESVYASTQLSSAGVDYYDSAVLKTKQGTTISLSGASTMPKEKGYMMDIRIFGTEGVLAFDIERERMVIMRKNGQEFRSEMKPGDGNYPERTPIHCFLKLCKGNTIHNAADGTVGRRSVETIELMYKSAESGKVEQLKLPVQD